MLFKVARLSFKIPFSFRAMSTAKIAHLGQNSVIGYLTDVEGNLNYWNSYLETSKIIRRDKGKLILNENCQFVYGGDVCDRGLGDIRILSDLVDLKLTYPDRVHFILGNRDINKMRVPFSLHPSVLEANPRVYWVRKQSKPSDGLSLNCRSEKMKWMLQHTMGSPLSFEYRRQELQELGLPSSDADVTDSYEKLVQPDGLLTRYLEMGKICVVLGDVAFTHGAFHEYNRGWVPDAALDSIYKVDSGRVPQGSCGGVYLSEFKEWVECINKFAYNQVQEYKSLSQEYLSHMSSTPVFTTTTSATTANEDSSSTEAAVSAAGYSSSEDEVDQGEKEKFSRGSSLWEVYGGYGGEKKDQPGCKLVQYGMGWLRDRSVNPSVIYSSYLNNGSPNPPAPSVVDWLKTAGVNKIVVGHQPNGDAPFILNSEGSNVREEGRKDILQVISGDTSYSRNTQWPVSQLEMLFPNSSATPGANTLATENEWMSYDQFVAHKAGIALAHPNDTRNSNTKTELLFSFPLRSECAVEPIDTDTSSQLLQENCNQKVLTSIDDIVFNFTPYALRNENHDTVSYSSSGDALNGKVDYTVSATTTVFGTLSQKTEYSYELPVLTRGAVEDMSRSGNNNCYIGKQTSSGWFVKACDIALPTSDSTADSTARYFLLSFSEGHVFKNRFVRDIDIDKEFA